jgi:hypothetical protein
MEQKLKERMLEESRYPDGLKEELWELIEARLGADTVDTPRSARHRKQRSKRKMAGIRVTTGVAAAAAAIALFLAMPAGTAFMKDVKSWFAPEKKVEVQIEGQKETTNQKLRLNEAAKYAIYYDQERYKLVQEDGKDVITPKNPLPDRYPEVSLTIEQNKDVPPAELARQVKQKLAGQYASVRDIEQVTEPVAGYRIYASDGTNWDSKVCVAYVTSNGKQGSFVLTEKYFMEASEGHGARFNQMLKQFKVLDD